MAVLLILPLLFAVVFGNDVTLQPVFDEYFVLAGSQLQLLCSSPVSTPPADLEWKLNGANLAQGPRIIISHSVIGGVTATSNLTIYSIDFSDAGTYTCSKQSPASESRLVVSVFNATVTHAHYPSETTEKTKPPAVLRCEPSSSSSKEYTLKWNKNFTDLSSNAEKYTESKDNFTLTINKPDLNDLGEYQCFFTFATTPSSQTLAVKAYFYGYPKVKAFDMSKNMIQGDKLDLICIAKGYPLPTVTWFKDGDELKESDRLKFKTNDHIENSRLIIDSLDFGDYGNYVCLANSSYHNRSDNATVTIRVKDKLAALWPFLGIVAEVFVLCVIIFIYERRRSKSEDDEDDVVTGNASNTFEHKGNDDVRQRNVRT